MNASYGTTNGEQLVRGQRHELVGSDGTSFAGECSGVSVKQGVLSVMFRDVEGDVKTSGSKNKWFSVQLSDLTTPRPHVLGH